MAAGEYAVLHRRIVRELALPGLERYSALYCSLLVAPLRRIYAWVVPSAAALDALAHAGRADGIVELGAGTGLWASLLRERGVRVHAYDMAPPVLSARPPPATNWQHALPVAADAAAGWLTAPAFTHVERGDTHAARAHGRSLLLLCWPPCEEDATAPAHVRSMARDAIAAHNGSSVALVVDSPWLDSAADGAAPLGSDARDADAPRLEDAFEGAEPREGGVRGAEQRTPQAAGTGALAALRAAGYARTRRLRLPSWPGAPAELQLWARPPRAAERNERPCAEPAALAAAVPATGASARDTTPDSSAEDARADADEAGARALRAKLVARSARELDELLIALSLRASGPLLRGERLLLSRCRRRAGGQLSAAQTVGLALRALRS
ncbi:hypothetical protein KFE25_009816 [Diacronema lutheri]|uniref:Uncharacterized protein n=1 Tax=Diacronema lutheri TaxID=2081491 RepID=A0A8J6BZR2_DIALT|nr:hypothetical protein KFE25_009816 [Diacronema lutheri]